MCLWVVYVILVDLISDNQDVVFVTKSDNLPQISLIHNLSSRVAGVDNNDSTSIETIFLSLYNFIFELLSIEAPASFLIKVVGKQLTTLQGESSWVKWVLGNGNKHTIVPVAQQELKRRANALTSTIS